MTKLSRKVSPEQFNLKEYIEYILMTTEKIREETFLTTRSSTDHDLQNYPQSGTLDSRQS